MPRTKIYSRREEDGDFGHRRHRSRSDRQPSPAEYGRDGNIAAGRSIAGDNVVRFRRKHHSLHDVEAVSSGADWKVEYGFSRRGADKKADRSPEKTKHSFDTNEMRPAQSYLQHDEGIDARRVRSVRERGWWMNTKEQIKEAAENDALVNSAQHRDVKLQSKDAGFHHYDLFYKVEENPTHGRITQSFKEKKILAEAEQVVQDARGHLGLKYSGQKVQGREKKEVKGHSHQHLDRRERMSSSETAVHSKAGKRFYPSGERYDGGSKVNYRA